MTHYQARGESAIDRARKNANATLNATLAEQVGNDFPTLGQIILEMKLCGVIVGQAIREEILRDGTTLFSDILKDHNISLISMMLDRNMPKPHARGLNTILEIEEEKEILANKD